MAPTIFDRLTRSAAAHASRRGLLARLTTTSALARLLIADHADVEAKRCPQCRKRKKGRCRKKRPDGAACGNGGRCRNGRCDHNVCTLDCSGDVQPQSCGPAGAGCQCVNVGDGVGACVKSRQGASCSDTPCEVGEVCGIPCTTYLPFCWQPCV